MQHSPFEASIVPLEDLTNDLEMGGFCKEFHRFSPGTFYDRQKEPYDYLVLMIMFIICPWNMFGYISIAYDPNSGWLIVIRYRSHALILSRMSMISIQFYSHMIGGWLSLDIFTIDVWLVGGLEHFSFFHILGMSSSQLTSICFRGVGSTTNQIIINLDIP